VTAVVGIAKAGKVYLGGDSAATNGWGELTISADPKVFKRGDFLFGIAGSVRVSNLVRYRFQAPQPQTDNLDEYMKTDFIDHLRECLKQGGVAEQDNNVESSFSPMLIGIGGVLYSIGGDFSIIRSACGYDAIGTGGMIAMGSLHATPKMAPMKRIQLALEAAEANMASVRGPFVMEKI
jgi:ATP-dependent protease HslVU (ClpYQ) peptidase subunit